MNDPTSWQALMSDPEAPFWFVWNPQGHAPTYKHPSEQDARKEAERLARLNPKQTFHVLEAKGCCTYDPNPVQWAKIDHGWVPF